MLCVVPRVSQETRHAKITNLKEKKRTGESKKKKVERREGGNLPLTFLKKNVSIISTLNSRCNTELQERKSVEEERYGVFDNRSFLHVSYAP